MSVSRYAATQLRRELADPQHEGPLDTDRILTTLFAALDEPETAVALLTEVWPAVPSGADQDFVRRLSDIGTHLAAVLPTFLLLAEAFRRAARSLRTNNQLRLAAIHGMRELAIHRRRDDDPDATAAALHDLAETYRAQGVLHKVIGCADEMLETYLLLHHEAGIAGTLTHLGTLMIEAHRPGAAVKYLNRADQAYGQLHDIGAHAECLTLLGRALWLSGDRTIAHRRFNRALALLIGTDDVAAQRVRDLVVQLESAQPEPEAVPEQPDQDGDDSDLHVWLVGRRHQLRPPDIQPDQRHRPEERP